MERNCCQVSKAGNLAWDLANAQHAGALCDPVGADLFQLEGGLVADNSAGGAGVGIPAADICSFP